MKSLRRTRTPVGLGLLVGLAIGCPGTTAQARGGGGHGGGGHGGGHHGGGGSPSVHHYGVLNKHGGLGSPRYNLNPRTGALQPVAPDNPLDPPLNRLQRYLDHLRGRPPR